MLYLPLVQVKLNAIKVRRKFVNYLEVMENTLAHTQLAANCEKLGGWDNAQAVADAIESGDIQKTEELVQPYPEAYELVERVITVSAQYR